MFIVFIENSDNTFILFPRMDSVSGITVSFNSLLEMQSKWINGKAYFKAFPLGVDINW